MGRAGVVAPCGATPSRATAAGARAGGPRRAKRNASAAEGLQARRGVGAGHFSIDSGLELGARLAARDDRFSQLLARVPRESSPWLSPGPTYRHTEDRASQGRT